MILIIREWLSDQVKLYSCSRLIVRQNISDFFFQPEVLAREILS